MTTTCSHESEIVDALMAGRWPEAVEPELREHAESCALCTDLVLVATAITSDVPEAAHIPTSGVVWWRMQRRDREEAARAAARTITFVQASSIVAAIALALTILGGVSAMSETWRSWLARLVAIPAIPSWSLPLFAALAVFLMIAPVALYFAVKED